MKNGFEEPRREIRPQPAQPVLADEAPNILKKYRNATDNYGKITFLGKKFSE